MISRFAFRNVRRNPRRSFVTCLTVAVGTAALFVFHGFNTGIMNQYRENSVHARFGFGQVNTQGYREQVYEKPWEHWIESSEKTLSTLKSFPEVTAVFPRLEFFALLTNGETNVSGRGIGIDGPAEKDFFYTLNIIEGNPLGSEESGIVLGKGLARTLRVKPGDTVTVLANTIYGSLNGVDLTVTGIFHAGTREMDDVIFQLPLAQAQRLLDTQKVETISLGLKDYDSWAAVASQVKTHLPELEATPFEVLDKVYYQHAVDWLKSQFGIIQLIILSVVLLGILNTVSSSIMERTREIGTLRANGETAGDILRLLAVESFILSILGATLGIAFVTILDTVFLSKGILMPPSPGITRQFAVFLELQWTQAVQSLFLVCGTAVLATLLAGVRVTRLSIADALRAV